MILQTTRGPRRGLGALRRRGVSAIAVAAVVIGSATVGLTASPSQAGVVGNGFTITPADLAFILKQIKISEHHATAYKASLETPADQPNPNPQPVADPFFCSSLVGPGPDQIPDALTAYGLRTVDGSCNNLVKAFSTDTTRTGTAAPTLADHPRFGGTDMPFPRLTTPVFRDAESAPAGFFGPGSPEGPPTSYKQKTSGNLVIDSQPRIISNLIVDQTSANPAAVAASGHPQRSQSSAPTAVPCTTDPDPTADPVVVGVPAGCTPSHKTLFIPNITTDTGLSPPYNSLFTFFGQFFDHGVDQTVKSSGTVLVPLKADDPLRTVGPDGKPNTGDEVPASQAFMALTRAQNQPGPDGIIGTSDDIQDANNTDSPWVDLSQDYSSHASQQVFLREYEMVGGAPQDTGRFLSHNDGGMPTWADVKLMAANQLGLQLRDIDVLSVPMLYVDPYGEFYPGPHGLPQYVCNGPCVVDGVPTASDRLEGDLANPVPVPSNVVTFDTPFLTDIAHNADPSPQDTDHNPATPPVTAVPDDDTVANHDFAAQAPGTYDDELLATHAVCGDGRCNENIALTTIHGTFHAEHNRLAADIKRILTADTSGAGQAALAEWKTASIFGGLNNDGWNGGRLFQAARFITEMEYQHIVFEEFARKVQPAVRPFHVYNPDVNPATVAEFAHAVYRFGHSMLDDTIARSTPTDSNDPAYVSPQFSSTELLDGFLNPPALRTTTPCPAICATNTDADHGMAAIIMGSSDQTGNEIDEFVTETLRNNLLGLPLDLPTINMARARSEGVPPLNQFRRDLFAQTNDGQLAPYTSWADYGQHLKHAESLVNFVAAYGTHPDIVAATTVTAKRAAARAIVDPQPGDVQPADAADFMFGTGAWADDANGLPITGLESVDLWVGGLAELTNQNGGMLGSTFNYVFQGQLEKLQDFDRLYYLNRTPGMSLRTQLEGNSFSELIQRNIPGTQNLKADAFARADCKFDLNHITFPNLSGTGITGATSVADDPGSECNENALLLHQPDGTVQYRSTNTVDPPGINGQAVYLGTSAADKIFGGVDNDTIWGGDGNDRIEGNNGDDVALGGNGDDIITDLNGADVPKGGPGNDAVDGGPGDDIVMGNDGQDFLNGGQNDNETFAGEGNDFIMAGAGADAVFGDGGDDWIQGGTGQDLLQGDHGAPFFDDPGQVAPGNDIFVGQPGENDYDAEGGDDVMAQNAAIDRNAGAAGFDWAFHQYDSVGADDDMEINNNLVGVPIQVVVNRDRWQETEADSGSNFNDVLKGTSVAPSTVGGAGFAGCDALDPRGVDRIAGLGALVTSFPSDAATIAASSAAGFCPLIGLNANNAVNGGFGSGTVWGEGDILIGGGGSDAITGRGANDIIDGDHMLRVRISVRAGIDANGLATGPEIASTDLMEGKASDPTGHPFYPGAPATTTLQQAVFAGKVNPGQLVAVREIVAPDGSAMGLTPLTNLATDCGTAAPVNCDTAVFTGPQSNYTVTPNPDGSITVNDLVGTDGIDTLWNVEQAQFTDGTVRLAPTASVNATSLAFGDQVTGTTSAPPKTVKVTNTSTLFPLKVTGATISGPNAADFSVTPTGTALTITLPPSTPQLPNTAAFDVRFTPSVAGASTATLTLTTNGGVFSIPLTGNGVAAQVPAAVTFPVGAATVTGTSATVRLTKPADQPTAPVTGMTAQLVKAGTTTAVGAPVALAATATSVTFTGLALGDYEVQVFATNRVGNGPTATSPAFSVRSAPTAAPTGLSAATGIGAGAVQLTWTPVTDTAPANGNSPITGYRIQRVNPTTGVAIGAATVTTTGNIGTFTVTGLPTNTTVAFTVAAVNAVGTGPISARVTIVTPNVPVAPATPTVTRADGTLTVNWTAPADRGAPITGYTVERYLGAATVAEASTSVAAGQTSLLVTGLVPNNQYRFRVIATNGVGPSARSPFSALTRVTVLPSAPLTPTTARGAVGGALTITATWAVPANTGGTGVAITGYVVTYFQVDAAGNKVAGTDVTLPSQTARTVAITPANSTASYRFTVTATNVVGTGPASAVSAPVTGSVPR